MERPASERADARGPRRVSGLGILATIVALGVLSGAGFYRFTRGRQDAELAADLERGPRTLEESLALWLRLVGPQIHHRLCVVGRLSEERPWLVTHAVARAGAESELWGIDCAELPRELARLEGVRVVVELPAPRALGLERLQDETRNRVPVFAVSAGLDPAARLRELALYLLEGIPAALARDVAGAELEIRVAAP